MEEACGAEVRFVSFPDVYFRISEALQSPKSSITQAELISKDTALSATLLKLANSAIYGVPAKVDSIQRAAALIGEARRSPSPSGIGGEILQQHPIEWVNMESFWDTRRRGGPGTDHLVEEEFSYHRKSFRRGHPPRHRQARPAAARSVRHGEGNGGRGGTESPLVEMERELFGFDHASSEEYPRMRGSPRLSDLVRLHHAPVDETHSFPAAALSVADTLAALRQGSSGSPHPPAISDEV